MAARRRQAGRFSRVAAVTAADTIYPIDRVSEHAILGWLVRPVVRRMLARHF